MITIEGVEPARDSRDATKYAYKVTARPQHAKEVTLYVVQDVIRPRRVRGYLIKTAPDSPGYVTRHTRFDSAVRSAHYRARRYVTAYAKPRTPQTV